jgi:hypothetical protein
VGVSLSRTHAHTHTHPSSHLMFIERSTFWTTCFQISAFKSFNFCFWFAVTASVSDNRRGWISQYVVASLTIIPHFVCKVLGKLLSIFYCFRFDSNWVCKWISSSCSIMLQKQIKLNEEFNQSIYAQKFPPHSAPSWLLIFTWPVVIHTDNQFIWFSPVSSFRLPSMWMNYCILSSDHFQLAFTLARATHFSLNSTICCSCILQMGKCKKLHFLGSICRLVTTSWQHYQIKLLHKPKLRCQNKLWHT